MAATFSAKGVGLRPHIKTSKCLEVVTRQRAAGTAGFTCSTPAEVEALGSAGFTGLLWAHQPVGAAKVAFAVDAAARWDVTLIADSLAVAGPLSAEAVRRGVEVRLLLDVDTGQHRTGVSPDQAVDVGRAIDALPGLRVVGVLTHEGHLGGYGPDRTGLETAGRGVGSLLSDVATRLREAGRRCRHRVGRVDPGDDHGPVRAGRHRGPAGHLRLLRRQPGAPRQRDGRPVRAHRSRAGRLPATARATRSSTPGSRR